MAAEFDVQEIQNWTEKGKLGGLNSKLDSCHDIHGLHNNKIKANRFQT